VASIALLCWLAVGQAPDDAPTLFPMEDCDCFPPLRATPCSLQFLGGYHALINARGARMGLYPNGEWGKWLDFNYASGLVRLGFAPGETRLGGTYFAGAPSLLFEYMGAGITDGFGHYLTGPSALARYTFHPDAGLQPYVQAGAGAIYTDADRDPNQRLIGGDFEFLMQLGVGLQCRLDPHWSLDGEIGLHHISNAGLHSRNVGANTFGAAAGVTYRFGR